MDLSGIQQAVQRIAEKTAQDQAKSGGGMDKSVPSADDVQKLQQALNQPPAEANPASAAQAPDKVAGVESVDKTAPGHKILQGMSNMRNGMDQALSELHEAVANGDLSSPADMLKVQMKLQQFTLQTDLTSKVVSQTEKNVDTLMKGQ